MIKKMTGKAWRSTITLVVFLLVLGGFPLYIYLPSVYYMMQGYGPLVDEPLGNIYGMTALGVIFILAAIAMVIATLVRSVNRRVAQFLEKHPNVTMAQLDTDFEAAEKMGDVWAGRHFTFCEKLWNVVLDNREIVWVFSRTERRRNVYTTYVCFGLVSGKEESVSVSDKNLNKLYDFYRTFPHIEVGNDPELAQQFKKNLPAFLERKYRQNVQL